MKLCVSTIMVLSFLLIKQAYCQNIIYYYSDTGLKSSNKIGLIHNKDGWELRAYFSEQIYYMIDSVGNKKIDSSISSFTTQYSSVGTFIFKKEGNKIYRIIKNEASNRNEKQLFYKLDSGIINISPDIFSNSDSHFIESIFLGTVSLEKNKQIVVCYKFKENIETYHKKTSRIVYFDVKKLIPYRIEYFNELDLKNLNRIIQLNY